MHSLIKTALIAAIGAAVVTASPAFAAKAKRSHAQAYGYAGQVSGPVDQGSWQIQSEYLKDAPIHNGNNY